jgi:hypothetical protein
MTVFSGKYAAGITLTSQAQNPVTVTGTITPSSGIAMFGPGGGTNSWTIANTGSIGGGAGTGIALGNNVTYAANGIVSNGAGGRIAAFNIGVNIGGPGTLTNFAGGTIIGTHVDGVYFGSRAAATVINNGVIIGGFGGEDMRGGGAVVNNAGATISGTNYGVKFHYGAGTITNAGVITGTRNAAVMFFTNSPSDRLIVAPSAVFNGRLYGGTGTMELTSAASAGRLAGFGVSVTNFASLQFDSGARWTVVGTASAAGLGTIGIGGFSSGDTIDVTGFAAVTETFGSNSLVLSDASKNTATLNLQGAFDSSSFHIASDGTGGTNITMANTLSWIGGSADWNTPSNWNLGSVPTSASNAVIANAGSNTVSISGGETVAASTVTIGGSDTLAVSGALAAQAIVDNALLSFSNTQTLATTPISLGGAVMVQSGGTLTLGSGEIVTVTSGSASFSGDGALTSKGTIIDAAASGTLAIVPVSFSNLGTIVGSGSMLTIGYDDGKTNGQRGTWSNSGVITLSANASLNLDGVVSTSGLGTINGATNVRLLGTLLNAKATLNVVGAGQELGTVNLTQTGVVSGGGTIVDASGTGFTFNGGAFSGVTYRGPLNIATNGGRLMIQNGLNVIAAGGTGAGTITLSQGGDAVLGFLGSQTIDNATINLNGTDGSNPLTEIDIGGGSGPVLTLGPHLTVNSSVANTQADIRNTTDQDFTSVVNAGTIIASAQNGSFNILPSAGFTNQGTILISDGEVFEIGPGGGTFVNADSGVIAVSGPSILEIAYSGVSSQMSNAGVMTLGNGSTLMLAGGPFTLASFGSIANQGATTVFDGEFDGGNGTISFGSGSEFNIGLLAGNISNATIVPAGSFTIVAGNPSLQNVVFEGPLAVTNDFVGMTIYQGVSFTDISGTLPGTVSVTGQDDTLMFTNNSPVSGSAGQTLDNVTLDIGNATQSDVLEAAFSGGTFDIGSHATIVSSIAGGLAELDTLGGVIDLRGTIKAIANGGTFTVVGNTLQNDGVLIAGNHEHLLVNTAISNGTGAIEIRGGAVACFTAAIGVGQTLVFADDTGTLQLASPSSFGATLTYFHAGNTIDLAGITATTATWQMGVDPQPGALSIFNGATLLATLSIAGDYSAATFHVNPDNAGGSTITVTGPAPCFAAGTRILTPRGAVAVERLRQGDLVLTVSGGRERIRWIGYRDVDCRRHINRERVLPIRIAAHAFGEDRPRRPLLLSPDHSVFVEGVLIPVRFLVNGSTIRQTDADTVSYFHIELDRHEVVLADGLPVETYLETGGRKAFANAAGAMQLHPDFAPVEARVAMIWQALGYAQLLGRNGEYERTVRMLAMQAAMLGCQSRAHRRGRRAA